MASKMEQRMYPNESAPYGLREDGTPKGKGFLGLIKMADGVHFMSEMSIGVNFDGKETLIPAIVPTLSKDELEHLRQGGKVTESIAKKAAKHARQRMKQGLSPFAD